MVGATRSSASTSTTAKEEWGRRFGMTTSSNPKTSRRTSSPTWSPSPTAAPTTPFDCTGQHHRHAPGAGSLPQGLGPKAIIIGVAEAGKEIATRPFQLVTGRVGRDPPSARPRTHRHPRIVDWYMDGKIRSIPLITHTLPSKRINEAFDLMHSGESIRSVVVF